MRGVWLWAPEQAQQEGGWLWKWSKNSFFLNNDNVLFFRLLSYRRQQKKARGPTKQFITWDRRVVGARVEVEGVGAFKCRSWKAILPIAFTGSRGNRGPLEINAEEARHLVGLRTFTSGLTLEDLLEKKIKVCFFEKELRFEISKRTRICSLKWPIGSGGNKNKDHKNHRIFFETQPSFLSTESSENEELLLFCWKLFLRLFCSKCPFVRSSRRSPVVGLKRGTASQVSVIFGFYLSSSF